MQIVNALNKTMVKDNLNTKALMEEAILDAYNRLIAPSIERDIRSEITETAQEGELVSQSDGDDIWTETYTYVSDTNTPHAFA